MSTILSITAVTEPDRQRFARFIVEAARELGANPFRVTVSVDGLMERLRSRCIGESTVALALRLDEDRLSVDCAGEKWIIGKLPKRPESQEVEALTEHLRHASESADPELLRRRNEQIAADLDRAKRRAAGEMAELEAMLEKKKVELQASLRAAETDSLTGLLNRGAFDVRLQAAVRHCSRQEQDLSLILFDLDHFKLINDTHGHQYGDDYLRKMAAAMRRASRDDVDHLCRIGGDEFAAIVFGDASIAARIAERVHASMDGKVSGGVAALGQAADNPDRLVAHADQALYRVKRGGRGHIAVYREELDAPAEPAAVTR